MRLIDADGFKEDIINTAKIMGNNSVATRMYCEAIDESVTVCDPAAVAEYVCDNLCRFSHDNTLTQEELEEKCEACGMSKLLGITEEMKDTTNGDPVSDHNDPWKRRIMERFTEVN